MIKSEQKLNHVEIKICFFSDRKTRNTYTTGQKKEGSKS